MQTKLIWITPDCQQMITNMARVSNPSNQGADGTKLLSYLLKHKHFSPFEMASACFEIETTRDIARQILRHRSFSFQEFSQRYAEVVEPMVLRDARLQDWENRQNSIETDDYLLRAGWDATQDDVCQVAISAYKAALKIGIAKEVARAVLPEGLTKSRMYMSGTIRSWLHYLDLRCGNGTQKEHIEVAQSIKEQLNIEIPAIMEML